MRLYNNIDFIYRIFIGDLTRFFRVEHMTGETIRNILYKRDITLDKLKIITDYAGFSFTSIDFRLNRINFRLLELE